MDDPLCGSATAPGTHPAANSQPAATSALMWCSAPPPLMRCSAGTDAAAGSLLVEGGTHALGTSRIGRPLNVMEGWIRAVVVLFFSP
jgi:hypothetical protein